MRWRCMIPMRFRALLVNNHYVQTFGAVYLGRLHEYQIAVFEQEAKKLLEVYTYEWNGSKENS